jgi:2-polyprenyl-3-methyl-5-hydroxy-6-metoxy-1,4-benzoquinol methylase
MNRAMRERNCIVCESDRKQTLEEQGFKDEYLDLIHPSYQRDARRLVICESCGFVYHDPQLDERDIEALYDKFRDASFRNESPDAYFDRITSLPKAGSENQAKVEWLRVHAPELLHRGGRLLDIGCGGGVFIHTFLQNISGWSAAGVEPTVAFAELAARRLATQVIAGSYRSGLFAGQRFDLISVNQVLEHVVDPVAFLADVREDLADGGLLYLEVPDVLDLGYLAPNHDRFMMQHLWVFSRASLVNVCRRAGYTLVALDQQVTIRQKRNLVALLSKSRAAADTAANGDLLRDEPEWVTSLRQEYHSRAALAARAS